MRRLWQQMISRAVGIENVLDVEAFDLCLGAGRFGFHRVQPPVCTGRMMERRQKSMPSLLGSKVGAVGGHVKKVLLGDPSLACDWVQLHHGNLSDRRWQSFQVLQLEVIEVGDSIRLGP